MATPKSTAMAEQAARDKAQATLDEILKGIKQIKEKLGIQDEQQHGEAPVDPTLQARAEREAAEQPAPKAPEFRPNVKTPPTVDPKAEAERLKQQARRPGNK